MVIGLVNEEMVSLELSGDGYAIERVGITFTIGLFQGVSVSVYVCGWSVTVVPSCSSHFRTLPRFVSHSVSFHTIVLFILIHSHSFPFILSFIPILCMFSGLRLLCSRSCSLQTLVLCLSPHLCRAPQL